MAAIVNQRDLLLQATVPRIQPYTTPIGAVDGLVPALKGLRLTATSTSFLESDGTTAPTGITLTAVRDNGLVGVVTWSVTAGAATLTGTGDMRAVAEGTVATYATIRASVVDSGRTYTDQITITRVKETPSLTIASLGAANFVGQVGTTTPATITLRASKNGGIIGAVTWSVFFGTATLAPSGDDCTVTGSSIVGYSVTIRARVTHKGTTFDAYYTLGRLGELSVQQTVNLTSQVTGLLASGNITGLGALSALSTLNLANPALVTGALNGATQVTNLGNLAYADAIAANQIGAGTLAAGVIYAGNINAANVNAGSFSGKTFTGGVFSGNEIIGSTVTGSVVRAGADASSPNGYTAYIDATAASLTNLDILGANAFKVRSYKNQLGMWTGNNYSASSGSRTFSVHIQSGNSPTNDSVLNLTSNCSDSVLGLVIFGGAAKAHLAANPIDYVPTGGGKGLMVCHVTHLWMQHDGTNWRRLSDNAIVTS